MARIAAFTHERPAFTVRFALPFGLGARLARMAHGLLVAVTAAHQRQAERDMARLLGQSGGRLTDDVERRAMAAFSGGRAFTAER